MIWANTFRIGCGFSHYQRGQFNTGLYACNYGPAGNIITSPMYRVGTPCSACPTGTECSTTFRGLCATRNVQNTFLNLAGIAGQASFNNQAGGSFNFQAGFNNNNQIGGSAQASFNNQGGSGGVIGGGFSFNNQGPVNFGANRVIFRPGRPNQGSGQPNLFNPQTIFTRPPTTPRLVFPPIAPNTPIIFPTKAPTTTPRITTIRPQPPPSRTPFISSTTSSQCKVPAYFRLSPEHDLCKFNEGVYGPQCQQGQTMGVKGADIAVIINAHNFYRNKVALGEQPWQRSACNMREMVSITQTNLNPQTRKISIHIMPNILPFFPARQPEAFFC